MMVNKYDELPASVSFQQRKIHKICLDHQDGPNSFMKQFSLFILLIFISSITFGQTEFSRRKSLFLEIAGSGGMGSINFEKLFFKKKSLELTWRAGISVAPIDRNNGSGIVFPVMIKAIWGKSAHKLEVGLGQGITITTKGSPFAMAIPAVGYRHQSESKKWFYRISYTPLISYVIDFQIQQWAGISIGYSFSNRNK